MNKRVLIFNKHYLPGFLAGGPIRSLVNMIDNLSDEFDFYVVTLDRDSGISEPYSSITRNYWLNIGPAKVIFFNSKSISIRLLVKTIEEISPNLIYLNSFFDPIFTQRILWAFRFGWLGGTPIILAPRGEFSERALNIKSLRKKLFVKIGCFFCIFRGLQWHVSTKYDHIDLLRTLGCVKNQKVWEAINFAPLNEGKIAVRKLKKEEEMLKICFLSRISPKKNLDFALLVLSKVKTNIRFTIYGPKEDPAYWKECEQIILRLPSNIEVKYSGPVDPDDVRGTIAEHDLFFFPTQGENYGHVIREALSSGVPVLISDQTPWRDIEERGVGWEYPIDSIEPFVERIEVFSALSIESINEISYRTIEYISELKIRDPEILFKYREMFHQI